jgi:hypothetical protein
MANKILCFTSLQRTASMVGMAKQKPAPKKKRISVFLSLDEPTEAALLAFIDAQRVKPSAPAVAFTALVEFLRKEGYPPEQAKK